MNTNYVYYNEIDKNCVAWLGSTALTENKRPIESSLCLLVDGIPGKLRKAALHGFGNAIVPQVGAEFIKAYMECISGQ